MLVLTSTNFVWGQLPNPVLETVFPPGGQAGQIVDVTVSGSRLEGSTTLVSSLPEMTFANTEKNQFQVSIPKNASPGLYDLRVVGPNGLSSTRTFFVSNRTELLEIEPNNLLKKEEQSISLNSVVNGRIEKGGDLDHYRFSAKQGQRVVIECWAKRIDSKLRAVLEVYDERGRRLAINRGYYGIDPLINFHVPVDGNYTVKLFDLVYSGSASHIYRLDIDTGPRVAFTVPAVVERGTTSRVTLYGWNLHGRKEESIANVDSRSSVAKNNTAAGSGEENVIATSPQEKPSIRSTGFDQIEVEITAPDNINTNLNSLRLRSGQATIDGFAYQYPNGHAPVMIGVTDIPVILDLTKNHSPQTAQKISFPCEVSGQLIAGDERDWYSIEVKRGEVLWIEGFGDRMNSPIDLDVSILDSTGQKELARFSDEVNSIGRKRFPSNHLDPSGRWVAPRDGRYLIVVRNLIGGLDHDLRRIYRLSIRREEPDFHLVIIPFRDDPATFNITRGGRTIADILAFRNRGATGSIRVSAVDLPEGIECPDVWLGPGVNRTPLTISAGPNAPEFTGSLHLVGHLKNSSSRAVRAATVIRTGTPNGLSRLSADIPLAVRGNAPVQITADGHETRDHHLFGELKVRHSPGSILDVAIHVERDDAGFTAPVDLIGIGLPDLIKNQTAIIPAGKHKGYVSFYLPPTLPVGTYTIAIRAQTTVPLPSNGKEQKTKPTTIYSNPVTFEVKPAAFTVEIDPNAPKTVKRGEITKVPYTVKRKNGFLSKIHTELWAPDEVIGLRARGSTSVGQSEAGTLQLIANEDAPLGRQPFVRFYAVGVVEDKAIFHGSSFLHLEIVE